MAQAGQGAIPAAPAAPTTTYFDLFSDAANNTMNGHVQTLLAPYNDFNNFTPVQVEETALSGRQGQPAVTYCFIVYHEESEKIHAYINPATYTASPIRTTPHDGEIFIQVGDLMEQQFSLAIWPRSMYHQSNNMLVPTAAQLDNLIAADPDDELFGPFQANDPNVELIRTRYCCLVPHAYIPLVIDRPHTPKELWTTLRGAIVNDQLEQQCEPLINYLRACMSRPTPNDLSHLALDSDDLPTVVALDPDLIAHRRRLLYEDFPHFNNAVGHAQATLVSQGIHALTQEVHLGRIESQQERDRARNKTFQTEYPASYNKLLIYAQVQNGNLLQPVWNQLARSKKGDRIRILSQHLELAKQQLQLTYVKVDTTPGILEKILNLQYHSSSAAGDFKEYFNSFLLDTSNSSVVQQATLYETLHSGGAAPSAADLQLISGLDIKAATDTVSYLHLIQKYLIYHQCLWGGAHPVTTNLATYYRMLNQKQVELQMYQAGCELNDRLLFWPRLQFKLQTEIDYWFDMASYPNVQPADLPTLNTHGVFQSIRLHHQWEPVMGSHFLEQLGLNNVNSSPSLTTGGVQGRDDSDSRDTAGGNRTITNPTFNADLFNQYREDRSMRARDVRARWLAAGLELPKSRVDSNKTMCLAYHVKGTCNEGCRSAYDHVPYSASQYAPMVQLCSEHWPHQ